MSSRNNIQSEDAHADDLDLYEQLAKLQSMSEQVEKLRKLLPDGLLKPTHLAGKRSPEILASGLKDAATVGSAEIKSFKRAYHSDEIRTLWQTVNSSQLYQGNDVWTIDYSSSLPNLKRAHGNGGDGMEKVEAIVDSLDPEAIIKSFQEAHPTIKIEVKSVNHPVSLDLSISAMRFSVSSSESSTETRPSYTLASSSAVKAKPLQEQIIKQIEQDRKDHRLSTLLSLLASYSSFGKVVCHKCKSVFDTKLDLPLLRERIDSKEGWSELSWKALHRSCS